MVGLVVIVAFCLYTAFAVFVARRVGRLAKSRVGQNALIAAVLAVLYLAPIADGIYGYFVLQHLCATEAKTEVLKPIKIPPEYFNPDGSPKFVSGEFKHVEWKTLKNLYQIKYQRTENYQAKNLVREVGSLVYSQTGEVFARQTDFFYRGGWLRLSEWRVWGDACSRPATSFDELLPRSVQKE